MHERIVAFVTDRGYLVPSLVAAKQLVEQNIHAIADIVIYTIDIDEVLLKKVQSSLKYIKIVPMTSRTFQKAAGGYFYKNHVPVAAMARLSLQEIMPSHYKHIVYMDGDVQLTGSVLPLIAYSVPDGYIAAGAGSAWIEPSITPDGYLEALGGIDPRSYFNSGVLSFRRSTWDVMAPIALDFFIKNAEVCIRHDQSALNAVFKNNVINFAPRYNFHHIYARLGVHNSYQPSIVHFTGSDKPWNYAGPPWYGQFANSYRDILADHPELGTYMSVTANKLPRWKRIRSDLKFGLQHYRYPNSQRAQFFEYIADASFPF